MAGGLRPVYRSWILLRLRNADCGLWNKNAEFLESYGFHSEFRIPKSEMEQWGVVMNQERKVRILIAKPGLDGHDRGAKVIARGFRDAGFEVIYTGLHQTPEQIVAAAIQEDVDGIGLSSLSGAHDYLFPRVIELLKEKGAEDIVVFGGGIIPEEDIPELTQCGIRAIFPPGTPIDETVKWARQNIKPRK